MVDDDNAARDHQGANTAITDMGDTTMSRSAPLIDELRAAYNAQLRASDRSRPQGTCSERDGPVVRTSGPVPGQISAPPDLGLHGAELDALITRQRDHFAARRESVEWTVHDGDLPAELVGRLLAAGFEAHRPDTVVVTRVDQLAGRSATPAGVTCRQVSAEADLDAVAELEAIVWNQSWNSTAGDLAELIEADPDGVAIVVAEADERVVSAGWLVCVPGTQFGTLVGGSTLREWRGRGIYRALVARRAALAHQLGVTYLRVDASPDSAPILRRLGFHTVSTTTAYVWSPLSLKSGA